MWNSPFLPEELIGFVTISMVDRKVSVDVLGIKDHGYCLLLLKYGELFPSLQKSLWAFAFQIN